MQSFRQAVKLDGAAGPILQHIDDHNGNGADI